MHRQLIRTSHQQSLKYQQIIGRCETPNKNLFNFNLGVTGENRTFSLTALIYPHWLNTLYNNFTALNNHLITYTVLLDKISPVNITVVLINYTKLMPSLTRYYSRRVRLSYSNWISWSTGQRLHAYYVMKYPNYPVC